MYSERSPCFQCERLTEDKRYCATSCEKLKKFMEKLPYFLLTGEDLTSYTIPGLERRPAYLNLE
jgi:hypothetical protein